jgi:osmoprotectant transport system substrate-binding protein
LRKRTLKTLAGIASAAMLLTACGGDSLEESGGETAAGGGGGYDECRDQEPDAEAGGESLDGAQITVGSKDFDEQLVLGNVTKLALEAAGATVDDQVNLGGTDANRQALISGEIDTYWEYNGTAWISFFEQTDPIQDRQEQYEVVRNCDWANNQLMWLEPAPFNNTYGIAFRSEAAEDLGNPAKLSDLGSLIEENPDEASLCVETEFAARNDGLPGLEETYGYTFPSDNVTTLDTGVVYSATDEGDPCNFGEIFTTDGRIAALDLTVLEDDEGFFPLYNASPVFTGETYEQYGQALEELFGPIAAALDQDTMTQLNARVSSDNERPEAVAQDFLESNDLLPNG